MFFRFYQGVKTNHVAAMADSIISVVPAAACQGFVLSPAPSLMWLWGTFWKQL